MYKRQPSILYPGKFVTPGPTYEGQIRVLICQTKAHDSTRVLTDFARLSPQNVGKNISIGPDLFADDALKSHRERTFYIHDHMSTGATVDDPAFVESFDHTDLVFETEDETPGFFPGTDSKYDLSSPGPDTRARELHRMIGMANMSDETYDAIPDANPLPDTGKRSHPDDSMDDSQRMRIDP